MGDDSVAEAIDLGVRIERRGALCVFSLDRPRALNALNDRMRAAIAAELPGLMSDPEIYAVAFQSTSERAFCAGGDIRELSALTQKSLALGRTSLADEYRLNWQLDCFNKPSVSFINGMCVGSGVGLTLYNTHRVAGENYSFAMPETGIGLFPDLGVCRALARMPDQLGVYLGLTGRSIGPVDAYALGLVTHCIPSEQFETIAAALADAHPIDPLLEMRHKPPADKPALEPVRGLIRDAFSGATVEEIMAALAKLSAGAGDHAEFARGVHDDLARRCPTSLKVTLRHLQQAGGQTLKQTLEADHRIASHFLAGRDFHEGVRAVLIDRDHEPNWDPKTLADVTVEDVQRYFGRFDAQELVLVERSEAQ
ncbi:MAG: enoyl-CoA hydratase/isomerase family protein [Hyphomicrobiaceae bacterium]|nr:enoyl-CoA hydratase/isomerase family protein [Hyphomicrobiaceae bacterium]